MPETMPRISADNPLLFLTSVTRSRIPVFAKAVMKALLADAFDEARRSGGFHIFAYVIMPDHYHIITDGLLRPSDVLRYLNGISARRTIQFLKENGYEESLAKLRKLETGRKEYRHSLWEHHSNTFLVSSESILMQKVRYIHQNPVEEGMVEAAADYQFSSSRYWLRKRLLEDEPLEVDLKLIQWKT